MGSLDEALAKVKQERVLASATARAGGPFRSRGQGRRQDDRGRQG